MLLHALRGRPRTAEHIVRNLCDGQDPASGWWGYGPGGLAGAAEGAPFSLLANRDFVNLSTSQYGALGLWAGARTTGEVPLAAWRRHLVGLCASQQRDGSWSYAPRTGAAGYPNGTFMGVANLVLARHALSAELEDDPVLAARSAVALRAGRRALDRDAPAALSSPGIDYYGWYALEKACVFLDLESPGGIPWYVVGAERLLADQTESGGWGGSRSFRAGAGMTTRRIAGDEVSTAFALLFLLRASETYHPTTPRDVDAPGPTTPGGGPAPPGTSGTSTRGAPPAPPAVRLGEAQEAVDRLARSTGVPDRAESRDGRRSAERRSDDRIDDGLAAIDTIRRALRIVEPDLPAADRPPPDPLAAEEAFVAAVDAWRGRAGASLVEALSARSSRLALAAAEALDVAPRSTSAALRTRLDGILRGGTGPPRALVEAAFRAIAAQADPRSLVWLTGQVSSGRAAKDVRCTRAALVALAEWGASTTVERRTAALRVARELQPLEKAAAAADPDSAGSWTDHEHWQRIGPAALRALDRLCRDPEAPEGVSPWGDAGAPTSVTGFREWIEDARRR